MEPSAAPSVARPAVAGGTRDALLRGLRSSRANWPLIVTRWLQDLVTVGLAAGGLAAPWIAVFGWDVADDLAPLVRARGVDALAVAVLDIWETIAAAADAMVAGLAGLVVAWTLALAVYCWAQGGIWAVLADAERGATEPGRPAAVFRVGRFLHHGQCYFWRLFWLVNLYATAILGLVLLWLLPLVWLPRASDGSVPWPALVAGLALLLPVALASAATALWYALARAGLALTGGTARAASRRAWRELTRRPGPPLLVSLLALAGVVAVSAVLAPVGSASLLLGAGAALAVHAALFALQGLTVGWLSTVHAGALVALLSAAPGETR